ncbi:MAG TPA: glycine cleavage system protein GcvH [Opitutaceae bacterium]|nr:glycine cleavage system protein GcvH [Opitutaceae bacterium]
MSEIPAALRYTESHEWIRPEPEPGVIAIGITDYAQQSLGDITFVQLPKVGTTLEAGRVFGVIESVKAASDLYAPATGTVVAVNDQLDAAPETINRSPYESGWLLKLRAAGEVPGLLSPEEYRQHVGS